MGGHGYSAYAKIPGIFNDFAVSIPGEGENMVLMQQTAQFLIHAARKASNKQKLKGQVKYIEQFLSKPTIPTISRYLSSLY